MPALESTKTTPIISSRNLVIPPSPVPTSLSFNQEDDKDIPHLRSHSPKAVDLITRDIDRDTPGGPGLQKRSSKIVTRKQSVKGANYYGEVFAVREQGPTVPQNAGVYVELKTNVIFDREKEFEFAKALSEMIAKRYSRQESAVCVSLDHSQCMIMGGAFDGLYVMTVTSVSMISPTVNKRNAALIADWMTTYLGVPGDRGYIRFVNADFANFASGGVTMLDLMEKEEVARTGTTERTGILREKSVRRSVSRNKSSKRDRVAIPEKSLPVLPQVKEAAKALAPDDRPQGRNGRMRPKSMFNLNLFSRNHRTA